MQFSPVTFMTFVRFTSGGYQVTEKLSGSECFNFKTTGFARHLLNLLADHTLLFVENVSVKYFGF